MKKKAIIGFIAAAVVSTCSIGYAKISSDCSYDDKGQFHSGGKVYAMGSMEDARACATNGLLPQAVLARLGLFGSSTEAEEIKALNAKVIAEKEAAKQKAAEAEAAKKAAALLLLEASKEKPVVVTK